MSLIKQALRRVSDLLGIQVIRQSRSPAIARLTGARNVLNASADLRPAGIEGLGHAALALQLQWLIDHFQIDCVLDVGANTGQFAGELRDLGYSGRIVSFEPMAECVETLRQKSARDSRWTIFPCGLGSCSETREITRFADSTFSSLHTIHASAQSEFGRLVEPAGSEVINLRTLDEVWDKAVKADATRNVLLKVDTQGHDLEVLRGAPRRLSECAVVLCEASFAPIYQGAPRYQELFRFLEENGFECAGVNTLCLSASRLSLIEANALFINARIAANQTDSSSRPRV